MRIGKVSAGIAALSFLLASPVMATTLENELAARAEMSALQKNISRLKLQIEEENLRRQLREAQTETLTSGGSGATDTTQSFDFGPTPEQIAEQRRQEALAEANRARNAALDGSHVVSVMRTHEGAMRATLGLRSGRLTVTEGHTIGNWVVDQISIDAVSARNITTGERRFIPSASEVAESR